MESYDSGKNYLHVKVSEQSDCMIHSDGMSDATPVMSGETNQAVSGKSVATPSNQTTFTMKSDNLFDFGTSNLTPKSSKPKTGMSNETPSTSKNTNISSGINNTSEFRKIASRRSKNERRRLNQQIRANNTDKSDDVTQTPKRKLDKGNTPPNMRQPTKKRSYAQVAQEAIGELIIFNNNSPWGKVSREEQECLKVELTALLDAEICNMQGVIPRFSSFKIIRGYSTVSFENVAAVNWLKEKVPMLKAWSGSSLKVISSDELPKPIRFRVWVPGLPEAPEKIFERL